MPAVLRAPETRSPTSKRRHTVSGTNAKDAPLPFSRKAVFVLQDAYEALRTGKVSEERFIEFMVHDRSFNAAQFSTLMLEFAAHDGFAKVVEMFIQAFEGRNRRNWPIEACINAAVFKGHIEIVRYLLENFRDRVEALISTKGFSDENYMSLENFDEDFAEHELNPLELALFVSLRHPSAQRQLILDLFLTHVRPSDLHTTVIRRLYSIRDMPIFSSHKPDVASPKMMINSFLRHPLITEDLIQALLTLKHWK